MMETARLKPRRILTASTSKLALPEADPMLDLTFLICRRAKQMDVIWHYQITTNSRIGVIPRRNKSIVNTCIRKTWRPVLGANGEEYDCGLATENENTLRWMPPSHVIAHIWPDRVSPYQNSALFDSVAKLKHDRYSHKPQTGEPGRLRRASPYRIRYGGSMG